MIGMKRQKPGQSREQLLTSGYQQSAERQLSKGDSVMYECTGCGLWFDKVRQVYVDTWLCWSCAYEYSTGKKPLP